MEIWKEIPEFCNYEVSNLGRVRKKGIKKNWRYIPYCTDKNMYITVLLRKDNKSVIRSLSRIVYTVFNGNLDKKEMVSYRNGKVFDCRASNLIKKVYKPCPETIKNKLHDLFWDKPTSEEQKRKISIKNKGKRLSKETKNKLSIAKKGVSCRKLDKITVIKIKKYLKKYKGTISYRGIGREFGCNWLTIANIDREVTWKDIKI